MAEKTTISDTPEAAKVADKAPTGLSSAQTEGYKGIEKAPAAASDAHLPGFALDKGPQVVVHPDGSAVVFNESGRGQIQSIRTFDGHLAVPGYGDDGTLNSLTVEPRGEQPYTLSRATEGKFNWLDSRTGQMSTRMIEVHAGVDPGKTAEIAMYHEGVGPTLFAPEAKVKPDGALLDFRFMFGRDAEYPFSSGSAVPFNNADGTNVSIFDPKYGGPGHVHANGEHSGLSAKAEIVGIRTDNGRGVSLGFDSAQKGTDGRPLITSANVSEADGTQFELKRVGDTDQWRDSRTGTLKNIRVESAIGDNASKSAEILIKDLDDPAKNLFFNPHGQTPQLIDKLSPSELKAGFNGLSKDPVEIEKALTSWGPDDVLTKLYKNNLPTDFRASLEEYGAKSFKDFSNLKNVYDAGFLGKTEEFGSAIFKTGHAGKFGLALVGAAGLYEAGKWAFGGHEKPAPAHLEPLKHLGFTVLKQTDFLRGEIELHLNNRKTDFLKMLDENSKAPQTSTGDQNK